MNNIHEEKYQLMEWLMNLNDIAIINSIKDLKNNAESNNNNAEDNFPEFEIVFSEKDIAIIKSNGESLNKNNTKETNNQTENSPKNNKSITDEIPTSNTMHEKKTYDEILLEEIQKNKELQHLINNTTTEFYDVTINDEIETHEILNQYPKDEDYKTEKNNPHLDENITVEHKKEEVKVEEVKVINLKNSKQKTTPEKSVNNSSNKENKVKNKEKVQVVDDHFFEDNSLIDKLFNSF